MAIWGRLGAVLGLLGNPSISTDVKVEDVEAVFEEKGMIMTRDQKAYAANLSRAPFAQSVAGAGEMLRAMGIVMAVRDKMRSPGQGDYESKFAWLVPARVQRDAALASARSFMGNPLQAVGIGGPADVGARDDSDAQFDAATEAALLGNVQDLAQEELK